MPQVTSKFTVVAGNDYFHVYVTIEVDGVDKENIEQFGEEFAKNFPHMRYEYSTINVGEYGEGT